MANRKTIGSQLRCPNAREWDDPDQDGMMNVAEMTAGTDPTDPKSVLVFESAPRLNDLVEADKTPIGAGQQAVYFQSVPGKQYEIQSTYRLGAPWQNELTVTATTAQKRVVLNKPVGQAFYRVMVGL